MKKLTLIAMMVGPFAMAQNVSIKKVDLAGEKIIISYSLQDSNPGNEYQLKLYSSVDNFMSPMAKVTGDVGDEVKPGSDRKIEWKIMEEMGPYKGKIALELRGKVFVPFVKLKEFDVSKSYKRGKSIDIAWKAGASNPINIELMKGSQRVAGESNLANSGNHTLFIPSHSKPGKDYRLKVTDSRTNDVIYSENFVVKPAVPMLFKVLPFAVIGAAIALTGGSGSNPDNGGTKTDNTIALPPFPGS